MTRFHIVNIVIYDTYVVFYVFSRLFQCRRVFEILLGWLNVSAIFKAKEVDQTVVADGDPTGSGVYKDHVPNVLGTEVNLPQRPMKFPTLCSDPQWVQQKMNDVGDIKGTAILFL